MSEHKAPQDPPQPPARAGDDDPIIVCCLLLLCCAAEQQLVEAEKLVRSRHPDWPAAWIRARAVAFLERHDYFRHVRAMLDAE